MPFSQQEILETVMMTEMEHLDIRTVTLGVSLRDCCDSSLERVCERAGAKIRRAASRLVSVVEELASEYGVPIANKRVSVTPLSIVGESCTDLDYVRLARTIDEAARDVGVDFIGGFSALLHKGATRGEEAFLDSIPEALSVTDRLCGSVNVATTHAGINMDAIVRIGRIIKDLAERTSNRGGIGCAKFVVFANAVEDNPFMAGAFFGIGEPEIAVNIGVSGPGVIAHAIKEAGDCDLGT